MIALLAFDLSTDAFPRTLTMDDQLYPCTNTGPSRVFRKIGIGLLVAIFWVPTTVGLAASPLVRPEDSVWEVNTRQLPTHASELAVSKLAIRKLSQQRWAAAPADALVKSDDQVRTIIYVHGNWTSAEEARMRGLVYYQALKKHSTKPLRFVVYSWPSDREDGFARDVLSKKPRLDAEAFYLASLMQHFDPQTEFGFLGFSFGGAVICGALHLDAGGKLAQRQLETINDRPLARLSLTAPAFDRNSIAIHGRYAEAWRRVDQVVNLYNSVDPVLKRFRFYDRRSKPIAAGYAGLRSPTQTRQSEEDIRPSPRLIQIDCSTRLGRTHAEMAYYEKCVSFHRALENVAGL